MATTGLVCNHCNDAAELVAPSNGSTLLANTSAGEVIVALHTRCEGAWAEMNDCRTLVPLKKLHRKRPSTATHALLLAS